MERISPDVRIVKDIEHRPLEVDRRLPPWARRTNPIIRRQLGMYWKTILPEVSFLVKVFIVQAVLVALTIPLPFLFDIALPTITASVILFPFALYIYVRLILSIGTEAAAVMTSELHNDTLTLLRVTPMTLETILASKIAASIWRQVENLGLLIVAASLFSMPILISLYASVWPLEAYPVLGRAGMVLGLAVSLLRLALEPFMVGAIGVMAGAALRVRASAVITTLFLTFFYFLLVNLPRLIPMTWPLRFIVEFVLPVALPLLVIWLCLKFTLRTLNE